MIEESKHPKQDGEREKHADKAAGYGERAAEVRYESGDYYGEYRYI